MGSVARFFSVSYLEGGRSQAAATGRKPRSRFPALRRQRSARTGRSRCRIGRYKAVTQWLRLAFGMRATSLRIRCFGYSKVRRNNL